MKTALTMDQAKAEIERHHAHNVKAFIEYKNGNWRCRGCFMHGAIQWVMDNGY